MTGTLGIAALLSILSGSTAARIPTETAEVVVHGPAGALLLMDGQALGRLPLPSNLELSAGPHRFRLMLGSQKLESDALSLPANRLAELNLTMSAHTLVAVLRVTPGVLLFIEPATLTRSIRERVAAAVAAVAKQEHAVLLLGNKQAALLRELPALVPCLQQSDCHNLVVKDGQVAYVLVLSIEEEPQAGRGACHLRAALLDARTHDLGWRSGPHIANCDSAALVAQASELLGALLRETASRPRGTISITSTPSGARALFDGRWLGTTPLSQEVFAGRHVVEIQRKQYLRYKGSIDIKADQIASVAVVLHRDPARFSRPLWALITGSLLIGGGLALMGLGTAALLSDGQCHDGAANYDTCSPSAGSAALGGGLLGGGAALTVGGAIMLAVPLPSSR